MKQLNHLNLQFKTHQVQLEEILGSLSGKTIDWITITRLNVLSLSTAEGFFSILYFYFLSSLQFTSFYKGAFINITSCCWGKTLDALLLKEKVKSKYVDVWIFFFYEKLLKYIGCNRAGFCVERVFYYAVENFLKDINNCLLLCSEAMSIYINTEKSLEIREYTRYDNYDC